jgi:6-phosphogluconolactonase
MEKRSMKTKSIAAGLLLSLVVTLLFPLTAAARHGHQEIGAVYTMTNAFEGNAVLVFNRDSKGELTPAGEYPTEGLGTGAGLGNQGAVILDPSNRWLFVVNPGSNDISVFAVEEDGLSLVERTASNGDVPISLTYSRNLLYVLNAGGSVGASDTISGFTVGTDGALTAIPGSTRPLSADSVGPAQIQFNSDGDVLVVTEKGTNMIDTYTVDSLGVPGAPVPQLSVGATPFGFAIGKRNQVFVSEAVGGAPGAGTVSSYSLADNGVLDVIDPSVSTTETAACWLLDRNGRTGRTGKGSAPIDMSLSNDGRNLYTLNSGNASISVFRVKHNGGLARMHTQWNLPVTANGLAAR